MSLVGKEELLWNIEDDERVLYANQIWTKLPRNGFDLSTDTRRLKAYANAKCITVSAYTPVRPIDERGILDLRKRFIHDLPRAKVSDCVQGQTVVWALNRWVVRIEDRYIFRLELEGFSSIVEEVPGNALVGTSRILFERAELLGDNTNCSMPQAKKEYVQDVAKRIASEFAEGVEQVFVEATSEVVKELEKKISDLEYQLVMHKEQAAIHKEQGFKEGYIFMRVGIGTFRWLKDFLYTENDDASIRFSLLELDGR